MPAAAGLSADSLMALLSGFQAQMTSQLNGFMQHMAGQLLQRN